MTKAESQPTPGTTRRTIIAGTAAALAAGLAPVIVTTGAADQPDPLPALVERFLPLFAEFRRVNSELMQRYAREDRLAHPQTLLYQFGHAETACIMGGDVSAIEEHYARCIIESTTDAQRQHFAWRRDLDLKRAREAWEQWDELHRALGLYDIEAKHQKAQERITDLEIAIEKARPTTLHGAVALLRYALANVWDDEEPAEDQPPEARSIASVIAFLEPLIAQVQA